METDWHSRLDIRQILMFEISICLLVAGISLATTFGTVRMWSSKAQLNGQMQNASAAEWVQPIEHFDLVGSFTSPPHATALADNISAEANTLNAAWKSNQGFTMRDDGFAVTSTNWLGRPVSIEFSPQINGADGYTVTFTCQSRNLPLDVLRGEGLQDGQDPMAACRATSP